MTYIKLKQRYGRYVGKEDEYYYCKICDSLISYGLTRKQLKKWEYETLCLQHIHDAHREFISQFTRLCGPNVLVE